MSDELLAQFLVEAPDLISQASDDLLALEQNPDDRERLHGAFRAVHTLKGSAGLFAFAGMVDLLHAAEDVLGEIRDHRLALDDQALGLLLAAVTRTEAWMDDIARAGAPASEDAGLAARLRAIPRGTVDRLPVPAPEPSGGTPAWVAPLLEGLRPDARAATAVLYRPEPGAYFAGDDPLAIARGVPGILACQLGLREPGPSLDLYDPFACNLRIALISSAAADKVRAAFRFVADQVEIAALSDASTAAAPGRPVSSRTLQIAADRIDLLGGLVDELVVARTALDELAAEAARGAAAARIADGLAVRRLEMNRLIDRLHDQVVSLRLTPLAPTLRRLPRLVRQAAAELGKTVEFAIDDEGARADTSVVEGLFEPLLHLLRNAVDHGLETPDERRAAGKPQAGRLSLCVRRRADCLLVEVADDGRGVDPARIRAAAEARGMGSPAELAALSDAEAVELIFQPGFSTAAAVTSLSGRGVGLDAVRNAVAGMGGTLDLASTPGQGASVTLSLPVSIAMTRLLVVQRGADLYGVPMDQVIETARVSAEHITAIRHGRAMVLRDAAAPLFDLGELLGAGPPDWSAADHKVVVVRGDEGPLAIRVDGLLKPMDAVMRPLRGMLAALPGVMGAVLLGDGRVMLALDLVELIG